MATIEHKDNKDILGVEQRVPSALWKDRLLLILFAMIVVAVGIVLVGLLVARYLSRTIS